jgi:hypothetical protein
MKSSDIHDMPKQKMRIHRPNDKTPTHTGPHTRRNKIRPAVGSNRAPKTLRRENNQHTRGETMNQEEDKTQAQKQQNEKLLWIQTGIRPSYLSPAKLGIQNIML